MDGGAHDEGLRSRDSLRLETLARDVIASWPTGAAGEIALTGSVARGIADHHSDVEMCVYVEQPPSDDELRTWIDSAELQGVARLDSAPDPVGTRWLLASKDGVWIEVGVTSVAETDRLIEAIAGGEVADHDRLLLASTVETAVPLRTKGLIEGWKRRLATYPPDLAGRIIRNNTSVWAGRQAPMVRWALVDRRDLLALSLRLMWDAGNLLRVLYAINERWEPDWKWIRESLRSLSLAPANVGDRLNEVVALADPSKNVHAMFELILETLDLVPARYDVSAARASIHEALDAGPSAPR